MLVNFKNKTGNIEMFIADEKLRYRLHEARK